MKTQDVMKLVRSYGDLREVREPTKAMSVLIEAAAMNLTRDARRYAVARHLGFAEKSDEVAKYASKFGDPKTHVECDEMFDAIAKEFPKVFK